MFLKIIIVIAILLLVFAAIVLMQPNTFRYTRSIKINAAPKTVFDQVNNFYAWGNWSPWAKLDPKTVNTFEGPASGVGAITRWSGNNKVGQGSMEITESQPADRIVIRLDFIKPMAATNTTEFTFTPDGNQTLVTWSMWGTSNFAAKAMGLIFNCEKIIGKMFDQGLSQLKTVSEAAPK